MASRRTVAVASGKGGVGKTTVAVGLALALAQEGRAVGLLDADLYGPDVPRMLGLTRALDAKMLTVWQGGQRRRRRPVERYGIKVWSTQFLMGERQPLAIEGSFSRLLLRRAVSDVDWGDVEWLIVDLPPGTADVQQHVTNELGVNGAILVVTPQDVAHLDAQKVRTMLDRADTTVIGGVENMAAFPCPSCGEPIELFPPTPYERTIWAAGVTRLARIPFSTQLARVAELGEPLSGADATNGAFQALAGSVVGLLGDGAS